MKKLNISSIALLTIICSAYSANCPNGWEKCWTGDSKFGQWVDSAWSATESWSTWQSVIPFSVPSPIAGKDDYAYDAMSYQYYRTRTEDRDGKDQWEFRDCENTSGDQDPNYFDYWSIVLPATYARTAKEVRNIIRITETDCSDPDNIYTVRTWNFSDVTTPSFGLKTLVSHQEPSTKKCEV